MSNPTIHRLLNQIGDPKLFDKLKELAPTELQSLLLEVFRQTAGNISPQQLIKSYVGNRFVSPSAVDPISFLKMELEILTLAKENSFQPIEMSPLAPLGNCSVIGLADQNKIVSAVRGTEIVADATNLMALETSLRRKHSHFDDKVIHLCCIHRHVRAQALAGKGMTPHFKVFCAVTAGRDSGSLEFEKTAFLTHLRFYKSVFKDTLRIPEVKVVVKALKGADGDITRSRIIYDFINDNLEGIDLSFIEVLKMNTGTINIRGSHKHRMEGIEFNMGDGGFVDWGQKLTSNNKERMFTSGIGVELLIKLTTGMI